MKNDPKGVAAWREGAKGNVLTSGIVQLEGGKGNVPTSGTVQLVDRRTCSFCTHPDHEKQTLAVAIVGEVQRWYFHFKLPAVALEFT